MRVELWNWPMELDATLVAESPEAVRRQVREYADGERETFDLSVSFPETFTGEVMAAMYEIPYGETRTYGDLATLLDTAAVAVGQACGRNPLPIVVPCHRVVGANGLGGYSADGGLTVKRQLLDFESEEGVDAGSQTTLDTGVTVKAETKPDAERKTDAESQS
jgi:methylated-DNA-[protein]-cysteine S-methyltransferase